MVAHAKKDHEKNVRLNCKVVDPNGTMCSWSCSRFMYCMRHHLQRVHNLSNIGKADFPTQYVFLTHTDAPLPKGVSLNYLLTFCSYGFFFSDSFASVYPLQGVLEDAEGKPDSSAAGEGGFDFPNPIGRTSGLEAEGRLQHGAQGGWGW